MYRRIAMLTVAAAMSAPVALTGAAWAQGQPPQGSPGASQSLTQPERAQNQRSGQNFAQMDRQELKRKAAENSAFARQTAELASNQAENQRVQEFARLEVKEQKNMKDAMRAAGSATQEAQLPQEKQQEMQRLQQARGAEFDQMFVRSQIDGHRELLQIQEAMLEQADRGSQEAVVPLLSVPAIESHIAMLEMIQEDLGNATAARQ